MTAKSFPTSLPPKLLPRTKIFGAVAVAIFLVYAVGVSVRSRQGIRVVVANESGAILKNTAVRLEQQRQYWLGEIAPGETKKVFVVPDADSSIRVDFDDTRGRLHSELVAGYVEHGYCDDVTAQVMQGFSVKSRDDNCAEWNWKSWYGFL